MLEIFLAKSYITFFSQLFTTSPVVISSKRYQNIYLKQLKHNYLTVWVQWSDLKSVANFWGKICFIDSSWYYFQKSVVRYLLQASLRGLNVRAVASDSKILVWILDGADFFFFQDVDLLLVYTLITIAKHVLWIIDILSIRFSI